MSIFSYYAYATWRHDHEFSAPFREVDEGERR